MPAIIYCRPCFYLRCATIGLALGAFMIGAVIASAALAAECPEGVKSCKVIVLTPQEENFLIGQGGILDTASRAKFLDLGDVVSYFRFKIEKAPAGIVKPAAPDAAKPAQ